MKLQNTFEYPGLIKLFEEISAIPRASYKEARIAEYLCEFARARGLEYYRDEANNVLINAPATKGYENREALLLQGHTDMVCEKNAGVAHDFDTDGLKLYEKDGWIRAEGTTLGADDGIAVAVMLYILDGGVDAHGPIQCLFTSSEEVGLDGVKAFEYSKIYARQMINMDSPEEDKVIAGCAGGQRTSMRLEVKSEELSADKLAKIRISGLFGGHSGEDIDKGRANANKLMGTVLYELLDDIRLVSIHGGSKDNAIPRECEAVVACCDCDAVSKKLEKLSRVLSMGLCDDDKGFSLDASFENGGELRCLDRATARKIVFFMHTVDNGIFEMNRNVPGMVEWSRNFGIVECDSREAEFVFSTRSSFEERIERSEHELDDYADLIGASIRHYNRYPGWNFAAESKIRDAYISAYQSLYTTAPEVTIIHAGLECGFISEAVPDMDIISCGPNVKDLHLPDERLETVSFERFFRAIKKMLED